MEKRTLKMAAILLASAERASQLAGHLQQHSIEAVPALGSDHFHRIVNQRRIDLVIVEHQLQGFLSGLEILERMHGELIRPPVLFVAPPAADLLEHARRLEVTRVMPVDSSLQSLASEAKSILAASLDPWNALLPREARVLVATAPGVSNLPPLLLKLCGWLDQSPPPMDLVFRISANRWFTAELLRLAGAARNQPAADVEEALQLLGAQRSVTLLAAAGLFAAQLPWLRELPTHLRRWYYGRSMLIGCAASCFGPLLGCRSSEAAFVLGLIQDSGIGLLASIHGEAYTEALKRVQSIGPLRLEACEQQTWNLSHAEVTAALLRRWSLPGWLAVTSLWHHRPDAQLPEAQRKLLHAAQIGEAVANLADCHTSHRQLRLFDLLSGFDEKACLAALAETIGQVPQLSGQLALPPPDLTGVQGLLRSLQSPTARWEIQTATDEANCNQPAKINPSSAIDSPARTTDSALDPSSTILVIDDDASVKTIELFVAETGISVLACSDLQAALLLAPQAAAILCEIHLAQESGLEIVATLRRDAFDKPILITSGDCSRDTVATCLNLGIDDYLIKPFSKGLLMEKLRKHANLPRRDQTLLNASPVSVHLGFAAWATNEAVIRG